ncbi:MAG: Glutaminyl-tRNA synthetase [Cirrosporium novae-zelandiae]|nr:MAG: Glutaminyl-tRNA synthetase [Cirrosporium novae-zelandiae]
MADTGASPTQSEEHPPLTERLKETAKDVKEAVKPPKEKKQKAPKKPKEPKAAPPPKQPKQPKAPNMPVAPIDAQAIFKEGFLKHVYGERPTDSVMTRFPPEPNGFLHIGHSKAIAINFGFAKFHGGKCYLRYDDTNPEKEDEIYFTSILEMIEWLGFHPYKITYSSDHFQRLYDLAEDLIKRGKGYVCHCSKAEINKQRGGDKGEKGERYACEHRERPIEESLAEFRGMRDGKYKAQEASLRMKQDLTDGNPQMWDLTAYRVVEREHHRTGDKWRIYPTYDFTHCLCDSFENITHSLCTTEFINSRVSYEWLCDALELYKPMQREYGRLNITGTVLSKRKILALVEKGIVRGWDDPRLYTLIALRRRGVPPGAILAFVSELGVSTTNSSIQLARFEQAVRRYLEQTVPRLMLLMDPIPVIITNLPDDHIEEIELPFAPKDPAMGAHTVPFTKKVYIDRCDFREVDSKDFFRMAPGKSVGLLKVPFPIKAESFKKDESTGLVTEVYATYEKPAEGEKFKKPKTYIQWVADSPKHGSPMRTEVRVFNSLFKSDNPDSVEGGFLNDVNPTSEEIYPNAMVETGLGEVRDRAPWPEAAGETDKKTAGVETVRFQGMRVAYFAMDSDTKDGKIVLNRIVSLKEDTGKAA